jgi:hypothetical protein
VITSKNPPHTFLSARSYLLLEEQYNKEHAKSAAQRALLAASGPRPPAPTTGEGGSSAGQGAQSTTPHPTTGAATGKRGRGRGRGRGGF